jgi:hypothetical protein
MMRVSTQGDMRASGAPCATAVPGGSVVLNRKAAERRTVDAAPGLRADNRQLRRFAGALLVRLGQVYRLRERPHVAVSVLLEVDSERGDAGPCARCRV